MHRKRNWLLWIGFLVVLIGFFSAQFLVQAPALRDIFPWPSILIMVCGCAMIGGGMRRAFRQREVYRGRIVGPLLAIVSLLAIAFLVWAGFFMARQIPKSAGAPHVGQPAPEFSLPDQDGQQVALADLLRDQRAALLIFYRGHW